MSENKGCACALCNNTCGSDAPILTMGPYGNPRLICSECAEELDIITLGKDVSVIKSTIDRLGKKMSARKTDELSLMTVNDIFLAAEERAKSIEEGSYDFSLDEQVAEDELIDIPEEQRETEEDKLLDEKDAKKNAIFDTVFNWVLMAIIAAGGAFIIWKLIEALT